MSAAGAEGLASQGSRVAAVAVSPDAVWPLGSQIGDDELQLRALQQRPLMVLPAGASVVRELASFEEMAAVHHRQPYGPSNF